MEPKPTRDLFEEAAELADAELELEELVRSARARGYELELPEPLYSRALELSKQADAAGKVKHPTFGLTPLADDDAGA